MQENLATVSIGYNCYISMDFINACMIEVTNSQAGKYTVRITP